VTRPSAAVRSRWRRGTTTAFAGYGALTLAFAGLGFAANVTLGRDAGTSATVHGGRGAGPPSAQRATRAHHPRVRRPSPRPQPHRRQRRPADRPTRSSRIATTIARQRTMTPSATGLAAFTSVATPSRAGASSQSPLVVPAVQMLDGAQQVQESEEAKLQSPEAIELREESQTKHHGLPHR
jgi:hypothetical protein